MVFFILAAAVCLPPASAETIRVGIYQNPPKVFWNGGGNPQGIFVDIMNQIARNEGWAVEYVPGTWNENLDLLEKGGLDLLVDVTYSEERAQRISFNKVSVIDSWLQAFVIKPTRLESAKDLDGKRIAVLKGAVQEEYLPQEIKGLLNIDFTVQSYPDYAGTAEALRKGQADVIIASRFFYFSDLRGTDILPTAVMFRPSLVYFAFPLGRSDGIINRIDRNLTSMKNDPGSVYYRSLNRWLEVRPRTVIPGYIKWLLFIVLLLLLIVSGFSYFLKKQVYLKTAKLGQANEELEAVNQKLQSVDEELKQQLAQLQVSQSELLATEEKYRSLFESTGTAMVIIEEDTTISLANAEMEKLSGYSRGEIEGKMKWTEFVSKPDLERMKEYHRQRRQDPNAAPRRYEFRFIDRIGMIKDIFLSVDIIPGTGKSVASLVDITKRKAAELQVKASLREKELLLREIYHRVKNNLQVVSSLLSLQSGYVKDPSDKEIFLESQNRIRSMSLVHENLYKSSNLARIDFGHYARNLISDLIRSYGILSDQIVLTLDINDIELGVDVAIPCGLMINEMVSNSLKHAFKKPPAGGNKWEITVRLKLEGDVLYRLEVADNGTGFADKPAPLSDPATLGLQLITILAEQLDGKVTMQQKNGTRYVVEFRKVA
ncbi:MAG: transporter substrate-binding domain-containing protein [Candidatus Edwardsbacteria bacterium]|nr:transporter substrate-binding domain-containing protein [Candidatus Edwardsbacteria bacterium]MBU1577644.1 transporter substrate-binding domain-containing protein [Candidatus Edwardsbacteria bacterium]MBU2463007.1 transporter substrate-binding domain-containing protein [Candidatus Edwardsbacteria bacterium]